MDRMTGLVERLRKATDADRELFLDVCAVLGVKTHGWHDFLRYLGAKAWTDAALALVAKLLPGWRVENLCEWDDDQLRARGPWNCDLMPKGKDFSGGIFGKCPHAPTAPLAILAALITAIKSHPDTSEREGL